MAMKRFKIQSGSEKICVEVQSVLKRTCGRTAFQLPATCLETAHSHLEHELELLIFLPPIQCHIGQSALRLNTCLSHYLSLLPAIYHACLHNDPQITVMIGDKPVVNIILWLSYWEGDKSLKSSF